ncbi:Hypothetical_protein [Hexamita inflata]|uniref:Hypothetical_protein n=1 Tax=Hexamita inflata TaxID=28002 RepID=A0AA86QJY9_9EUKA|nr:Hypothetical protein HINF_LOCUS45086 [Hexamita inflata]
MVEVVFENFVNYLRSGNTDKLNIISFQQNQQHKINLSTQLIFYRILTKTVVQLNISNHQTVSFLKILNNKNFCHRWSLPHYLIKQNCHFGNNQRVLKLQLAIFIFNLGGPQVSLVFMQRHLFVEKNLRCVTYAANCPHQKILFQPFRF